MTGNTPETRSLIARVIQLARADVLRSQTDFIGRMHQAMGNFEDACDEWAGSDMPDTGREDADEALAALAGLALAQLAMLNNASDPIAALATPSHTNSGSSVREVLRKSHSFETGLPIGQCSVKLNFHTPEDLRAFIRAHVASLNSTTQTGARDDG